MKAKIWNFKRWLPCMPQDKIKIFFKKMLQDVKFNLLGYKEHIFEPQGYTIVFLLAESHFAVHTFPEHNKMYIELSSCNKEKHKNFKKKIKVVKL